tara:strand:- start:1400 stop:1750 length:351 start_codon:yes stop_codon:yes gene_type:complete
MKNFNDMLGDNWPQSREELVDILQKELLGRNTSEKTDINVANDIFVLIKEYLIAQNMTQGGELSEFMLKKAHYASKTIADAVRWDDLTQKMLKMKESMHEEQNFGHIKPFEPEKID